MGSATVDVVSIGVNSNTEPFTVTTDVPAATLLTPNILPAFSPAFTLSIDGIRFRAGDVVRWTFNGVTTPLTTNFISQTNLTAVVPASVLTDSGLAVVSIIDPTGQISNDLPFTLTPPLPILNALSPASIPVGSNTFTITLNGDRFVSDSFVTWKDGTNETLLATTYVSATQLTAVVPDTLLLVAGNVNLFVTNPGAGDSLKVQFSISRGVTLRSVSPNTVTAGVAFTLTMHGSDFVDGAMVQVGTTMLPTTFVDSTLMTAAVPGSAIPLAGTVPVTVHNPDGGVSESQDLSVDNPTPHINSISPTTRTAGGPSFTLVVTGTGFVPNSAIRWAGTAQTTTYISPTQIQAVIPASLIANRGNFQITVRNPTPGGGGSNGVTLVVN
jgi:hypothetical protein